MNQYQAVVVISLSEVDGSLSVSMAALCMDAVHGFVMEPWRPTGAGYGPHVQSHSVQSANRVSPYGVASSGFLSSHSVQLLNNGQQQTHPSLSECSSSPTFGPHLHQGSLPQSKCRARVSSFRAMIRIFKVIQDLLLVCLLEGTLPGMLPRLGVTVCLC